MPRLKIYAAKYAIADLGAHIKGRIKLAGITQWQLGEKLGMNQQSVSRLLKHPERLNIKRLREIGEIVELDSQVILKAIGLQNKEEK